MDSPQLADPEGLACRERSDGMGEENASNGAIVRFFAPPIAACAPEKSWRHAAGLLAQRLSAVYGDAVKCEFVELFSAESFHYPDVLKMLEQGSQPPFVTVNGRLIQSGGKLSERLLKEDLERIGIRRSR